MELCTFIAPVEHFFAGQRDLLEIGAVALTAGHFHLVIPCSPTSAGEEALSGQIRSSVVVTFVCVVNPQPRPPGLVAASARRDLVKAIFLGHVREQPAPLLAAWPVGRGAC